MLSPQYLDALPEEMVELISKLESDIIADITRHISKANYYTSSKEWLIYKANQLRLSSAEVNKLISKGAKIRENKIEELYTEAVRKALSEDAAIYRTALAQGLLKEENGEKIKPYFRSIAFNDIFKRGLRSTKGLMRNLTRSLAANANKSLSDILDYAYLQVASGAYTHDEAVYMAVKGLADSGIGTVSYPSGHKDKCDVAVRRAVRTGINKTCCDLQLDLAWEMECDLVEVSSHFGARPSHAEWQGQIYSISGKNKKYKPFSETGYGTGDGLGGWNCRHSFFPYFEGLSQVVSSPTFSKEENEEYYKLTQQQRAYEREIRKSKRQVSAIESARQNASSPDIKAKYDKDFIRASAILKNREKKLTEFCKANGLEKDNTRVRVVGFGKSVSQKAVWAAKPKKKPPTAPSGQNGGAVATVTVPGGTNGGTGKTYTSQNIPQNGLTNGGNGGTINIMTTNAVGTPVILVDKSETTGIPNTITQRIGKKGGIDRNYIGDDGRQTKQISNHDHGNPKNHPFGEHGEHGHDYYTDENGIIRHGKARELTDEERKENSDIL